MSSQDLDGRAARVSDVSLNTIDALTAANRRVPDARVEARLVELRARAFAHYESSMPRERSVEAVTPDEFPAPWEVQAADLTVNVLRRGIADHGSLLVRGLLNARAVDRLVFDIDRALEGARAVKNGAASDDTAPWYVPFVPPDGPPLDFDRRLIQATDGVFGADSPRTMFDLIDICEGAGLRDLITRYLGERPVLTAKKTTLRRTGAENDIQWWHQDGSFLGRLGALNVWFSLSHCGVDAPSLDLVNTRVEELLPTGTEGAHYDWSLSAQLVERRAAGNIVRPTFDPGDALLFDELLVHRTGTSPDMPNVRYAIETWFFRPADAPVDRVPLFF